ncbi:SDR family oxidoreductase [Kamptonema cortianum]|nr:SDR family oxidoreductase [Oscillatoria laete-virens]MDK3159939.1 SDR family oxidoreductase [Kamptonema cortianum]MDL5047162.1 SDR family oxidoreductase [Oscillatoria amoena NRMC-F 0135]MDL5055505.1 SDR family oxidoreductase [Oscillatoria laete-virens NRMC-F 0139]
MSLKGKIAIVTGASKGLGRHIALAFAREGAEVHALGRDVSDLRRLQTALSRLGKKNRAVRLDVRDEKAVCSFVKEFRHIDILVNNAGIARCRPLLETPTEELREILEVNVVGPFVLSREVLKVMAKKSHGGGHVINIASDAALRGIEQMTPYVASKHALLGMSRAMSREFRKMGVRVTTYNPGPIATEILGKGTKNPAWLDPEEIAKTIIHVAALETNVEVREMWVEPMTLEI